MKAFVCWSGGKDSCLSLYKVMGWTTTDGYPYKITYLLNMLSKDGQRSRSHGISASLLKLQAEAIGIPIVQQRTDKNYEEEFKKAVLSEKDVDAGVFGDIDLQVHRDWVEKVCKDLDVQPILPLWEKKRQDLMDEFIQAGFKAVVVSTNTKFLGKEWLGREINRQFVEDLKVFGNIDLCGEGGEYHSFVYDGPIFKKPVDWTAGEKTLKNNRWFLDILPNKEVIPIHFQK